MTDRRPTWLARPVAAALVVFTVLQVAYVCGTPSLQGPDEGDHLLYVRALTDHHAWPVVPLLPVDVRSPSGLRIGVEGRPTNLPGPATRQAQHPPLAYLVYAAWGLVVDACGGSDTLLRLAGLLWGWITIIMLGLVAADLWPEDSPLRTALPWVGLLPTPVYLCAVVSNDGAAMAAGAIIFHRLVRLLVKPPDRRDAVWLGLALGCGLAVKITLGLYLPFALALLLVRGRRAGHGRTAELLAICLVLAILPSGWWLARTHALYGHFLVRADSRPLVLNWPSVLRSGDALFMFTSSTALAFLYWLPTSLGQFWLLLPWLEVTTTLYLVVWSVAVICWAGLRQWLRADPPPAQAAATRLGLLLVLAMAAFYLREFWWQDANIPIYCGRYFLPFLGALHVGLLTGLVEVVPERHRPAIARVVAWSISLGSVAMWFAAHHPPTWYATLPD